MNRAQNRKTIHDELDLRAEPMATPPDGLAEALRREIPERLDLAPEIAGRSEARPQGLRRPAGWMLAAASVILAVGAGVVAVRVVHEAEPARERAATVPRPTESLSTSARRPAASKTPRAAGELASREAPESAGQGAEEAAPRARRRASDAAAEADGAPGTSEPRSPEPAQAVGRPSVAAPAAGAVRLRVTDSEGAELPGATVEVSGGETPRVALTDARGEAKVEGLAPGSYRIEAELEGYSTVEYQSVAVRPDRDTTLEVSLSPAVSELITVTSESPLLDEGRTRRGNVVSEPEARQMADQALRIPEAPPRIPRPAGALSGMAPSTGGTAEPNDQPYGDVFFKSYGTNPFVDTEDDPLSTFGLDVDTGSWGVVRRYLSDGRLPPHEAVRVEELVNAFDYGDPAPERDDFSLVAEGARSPFGEGARYHLIRFGLQARTIDPADRKPAVLTFVVDVSGSMGYDNRLELVKQALGLLLDQLRPDDRVALVVYGSRGRVVLGHTADREAIRRAVGELVPEGATNAEEGLELGYRLAREDYREGAINRVVLCSDGVANVGATGPDSILARIGEATREGIELTTVGFGMGNYNDVLMEQLADHGDGAYAYVDTLEEARRVFVENLTGTLQTVARDARVQVELDPKVVERYRLLGYENRDVPDERFRDDTVDAGEVGAGHGVTALYEVKLRPGAPAGRVAATLRLRYLSVASGRVEEVTKSITAGELAGSWEAAPRSLRLASVVAEFGEILEGSYWARQGDLDDLFQRAQKLAAEYPGDLEVSELTTLVGKAARSAGPATPRSDGAPPRR